MKILLIEPDYILAKNYQAVLEHAGHTVHREPSAQTALFAMENGLPDLVILELQIPMHNGIEFLYEFRSYPEWQHIPVVVLSLTPEEDAGGDTGLLEQLGVRGYLYKPQTKLSKLVRTIDLVSA